MIATRRGMCLLHRVLEQQDVLRWDLHPETQEDSALRLFLTRCPTLKAQLFSRLSSQLLLTLDLWVGPMASVILCDHYGACGADRC